jgi:hypothetical protein
MPPGMKNPTKVWLLAGTERMGKKQAQQETRRTATGESGLDRQGQEAAAEDEAGGKHSNQKGSGRTSKISHMP